MGLTESGATGRPLGIQGEGTTGWLRQKAVGQTASYDATTGTIVPTTVGGVDTYLHNVQFAAPLIINVGCSVGDDGGGDQVHQMRIFGTAGCPFKLRVCDFWGHLVDSDDTSATIELAHYTLTGAGALDTETTMTDVEALAEGDNDVMNFGRVPDTTKLIEAGAIIDEGEEIVIEVNTAAGAGSEFVLHILVCPTL